MPAHMAIREFSAPLFVSLLNILSLTCITAIRCFFMSRFCYFAYGLYRPFLHVSISDCRLIEWLKCSLKAAGNIRHSTGFPTSAILFICPIFWYGLHPTDYSICALRTWDVLDPPHCVLLPLHFLPMPALCLPVSLPQYGKCGLWGKRIYEADGQIYYENGVAFDVKKRTLTRDYAYG